MRIKTFYRALAMALLYIAVFVVLVVIQFPAAGPLTATAGGVSFKGLPGQDGQGIRTAEIEANGLRLVFSQRHPLVITDASGTVSQAFPESYETKGDGCTIRFSDGSSIQATGEAGGRASWTIKTKTKSASATIRYELASGAALLAPGAKGELRFSHGGAIYRISGLSTSDVPRSIQIVALKGSLPTLIAIREVEGKPAAVPAQFIAQAPMDPAAWAKEQAEWRDKAWAALSGPSFNASTATWKTNQDTLGSFDETRFMAYMTEAMSRERWNTAGELVSVVRASHGGKLSWRSVPFAGGTAASMALFEEANLAEVKAVERLVQSRSPTLFYKNDIVPLLFDRAPYSLAQEAMSLARSLDFSKADATQSISLIEAYLDARQYLSEEENPFTKVFELVDKTIAPAIRKADGGFFLQTRGDGSCDSLIGLAAGKALLRLAEAGDKPIYTGIGQSLVVSLLRLASVDGSIPLSVSVNNGSVVPSSERLSAASIYPVVVDSPYYPHALSFYKQLGPGSWAWTCSPSIRIETKPEGTAFFVDFPVGASHYMALYGVKPFTKIQLYDLDYNMDASFENYNASGYFYKKAAGAMYLKMRHKTREEGVRLYY
ncbi:MAG: hypothetical protein RBT62_04230 [Spirochaetia bacterium]|jgi:hypothetical protein|nr:hypothetical protein [Spirochaetia bacterium]